MIEKIKEHIARVEAFGSEKKEEIEQFRIEYLGKKGILNDFFAHFKSVPNEEKKQFGQIVNELKTKAETKIHQLKELLENRLEKQGTLGDLTRPGIVTPIGARHPISIVKKSNRRYIFKHWFQYIGRS